MNENKPEPLRIVDIDGSSEKEKRYGKEHKFGRRRWGWADGGFSQLAKFRTHGRTEGRERWRYGRLGSYKETAHYIARALAPDFVREAFEKERDAWSSKARAAAEAIPSRRRIRRWSDCGDETDFDRYFGGRSDFSLVMRRGRALPSVTLGINLALSGGNDEDAFVKLASEAVACVWALAFAGYPSRVLFCTPLQDTVGSHRVDWGGVAWIGKDWGETVDTERLLVCCLQGFYRDCLFGAWESIGIGDEKKGSRYGYCMKPSQTVLDDLGVDIMLGQSWVYSDGIDKPVQTVFRDYFERR